MESARAVDIYRPLRQSIMPLWMKRWFRRFFRHDISPIKSNTPAPYISNAAPEKAEKQDRKEHFGTMYYLDDLLDSLDNYFKFMPIFRRHDPDTYNLYCKIGGRVFSQKNLKLGLNHLPATWKDPSYRPALAFIQIVDPEPEGDRILPTFLYFKKVSQPAYVERSTDPIYEVCLFFAEYKDTKKRWLCGFYIKIDDNGDITPLKEKTVKYQVIKHKRGKSHRTSHIARPSWGSSPALKHLVQGQTRDVAEQWNIKDYAQHFFQLLAFTWENSNAGMLVMAEKNGTTASFSIDMLRTPYFFKDRKKTVTKNGKSKKIFHLVKAHQRVTKKGETNIKTHFRGERKFVWNGYNVDVSMPGFNHVDFAELDVPGQIFEKDDDPNKNYLTTSQLADEMLKNIKAA